MKIGLLTACYHPVINGVTRMVMLYARTLQALGHEPTIFTLGHDHPLDEPYVVRSPGRQMGQSGYYFATRYTAEARAQLAQMDILHAHHLWLSLDFAHRYTRKQPVIYTNHTRYDLYVGEYLPLLPAKWSRPLGHRLMRYMWPHQTKSCAAVISPSPHVKTIMQQYGVTVPIKIIPNGINRHHLIHPPQPITKKELTIPPHHKIAIYVGRLANEKRIMHLLQQFAQAQQTVPNLHLLLIGDGPQRRDVNHFIQEQSLQRHITPCGWVQYENIGNYLALADFFITASDSEVHPLTALEALTAGLPIIAPPAPWTNDCLPQETTILSHDLSGTIIQLTQNKSQHQQMSQAAHKASQAYDITHTVQQTIQLYETVLNS